MSPGVQRGPSPTLLPPLLAALGLLPAPRSALRPRRGLLVHFRRDGGQLLLHTLHLAHPGGQLRGLPAAAQGEVCGGAGLERGLQLELELESSGLWVYALSEQQGRALHSHIADQVLL